MADIKKREEITNSLLELITSTKEILVIISPYIQLSSEFKKAISALDKNITILIAFRSKDIKEKTFDFLHNLPNAILFGNDFLHTKCFMNESTAIITSQNLYDYSMKNNFELAVEFKNKIDPKNFYDIKKESFFILERSRCLTEQNLKYHLHDGKVAHCSSCATNIFPIMYEESYGYGIWRKEHLCQTCISDFEQYEKENNEVEIFKRYGQKCALCGENNDNQIQLAMGIAPICTKCNNKMVSPIDKKKIGKYN